MEESRVPETTIDVCESCKAAFMQATEGPVTLCETCTKAAQVAFTQGKKRPAIATAWVGPFSIGI